MVIFKAVNGLYYHIRALGEYSNLTISYCGKDYTWHATCSVEWDNENMCPWCLLGLMEG